MIYNNATYNSNESHNIVHFILRVMHLKKTMCNMLLKRYSVFINIKTF